MDRCPNCGYCPHCGRSNVPGVQISYQPWWPTPTVPNGAVTMPQTHTAAPQFGGTGGSYS